MRPDNRELKAALEALRDQAVVSESRDYARRWAQRKARSAQLRRSILRPACALAVTGVLGYMLWAVVLPRLAPAPATMLATDFGETRTVTLEDGSRIVLVGRSRLRVHFTTGGRDIELDAGQAHFDVAHDAQRPFRVRTASAEVVAVGTRFDVAALPTRTTVTLIEGRVTVRTVPTGPDTASRVETLMPGQQLGVGNEGQLMDKHPVKIESVTAWQHGQVILDDVPLVDALAILNRYSHTQIVIRSAHLQSKRISGRFRSGDVDTETLTLRRYFGLKENSRSGDLIVLEPH